MLRLGSARRNSAGRRTAQFILRVQPFVPGPTAPQAFNFVHRTNSAASAEGGAIQSGGRAAKFKYYWKYIPSQKGVCKPGMKDVAGAGRVYGIYSESGHVMESSAVPCQHAIAPKRRTGHTAAEPPGDLRQRLEEVRDAEQALGKIARADHEIHMFK